MKQLIIIFFLLNIAKAETAKIPFASKNNSVEFTIANTGFIPTTLSVKVENLPHGITIKNNSTQEISLNSNEEKTITLNFSVEKTAPVNTEQKFTIVVQSTNGEEWKKEITYTILAPEKFELQQNYPNPFNPTTTITYQLPTNGFVQLVIYNTLGQEISRLVEQEQTAGYHQQQWNASSVSSGMYIYECRYKNESGKTEVFRKRMMLVK